MKKLINPSLSVDVEIKDVGVTVFVDSEYIIPSDEYGLFSESEDLPPLITSGTLIVNDGVNDLSTFNGLEYIKGSEFAFGQRFLSEPERTNGLVSKTTQEAIEEVRTLAGSAAGEFEFFTVGSQTNKWALVNHPSVGSDEAPFICKWDIEAIGISFSNAVNDVEADIEFFVNGTLAYTWEIRDKKTAWITNSSTPFFSALQGDRVSVYIKIVSQNKKPNGINGELVFRFAANQNGSGGT